MRRVGPWLGAATFVMVSFGATGCRLGDDGSATVTETSIGIVESDRAGDQPVNAPADTPTSTTSTNATTSSTVSAGVAEDTRPLSDQELQELERELDEIDRLLSDLERAFAED